MLADGKARTSDQLVCCLTSFKWNLEWEGLHLCRSWKAISSRLKVLRNLGLWVFWQIRRPSSLPTPGCRRGAKTQTGEMLFNGGKGTESNCASWHTPRLPFLHLSHFFWEWVFLQKGQFWVICVNSIFLWRAHFFESHVDLSEKQASIFLTNTNRWRGLNIHGAARIDFWSESVKCFLWPSPF